MADLETIGKIYINWLQAHRNAYLYHKAFIDMVTKEIERDWGIEYQLDETPPDYDHTSWQEYNHKFSQESLKAQQLYKDLLEQADLYIAKINLGEIEDTPPDSATELENALREFYHALGYSENTENNETCYDVFKAKLKRLRMFKNKYR